MSEKTLPEPYYERDGITIYVGDNLDVLPHIGLGREVHTMPLDAHVARMAEADNIVDGVGIIGFSERGYRRYVVNIRHATGPLHHLAASLAGVVITHEGSTSKGTPVGAIVARMATAPRRIVRTLAIGVATIQRTECHAALALTPPRYIVEVMAAVETRSVMEHAPTFRLAGRFNQGSLTFRRVGVWLSHHALRCAGGAARVMAFTRTKLTAVLALDMGQVAAELLATFGAGDHHSGGKILRSHRIRTGTAARRLPSVLQALWICHVGAATSGACTFFHKEIITQ